ncbi:MAG: aryl-sulfate sulfotransferase [Bacteroidota bacterium]
MLKKLPIYFLALFFGGIPLLAQNTVGLLSNNPTKVSEGFNLIYPHNQSTVYLLNNCGEITHKWEDDAALRPGNMAYLNDDGTLFKCKRLVSSAVNDRIWAGGGGETVELRTWENELLASFTLNNDKFRLHHDIAPLPNGNALLIAWELKTGEEALAAGRDTSQLSQGEIWSERILEWNPNSNEIVWEWSVWDHLVQDFDATKANYGVVAEHPELININYDEKEGHPDWLHINAIDYNEVLDQFVLSVPHFNELWIVDHSTTQAEANSHTGGNSGKGGNLLYRWGNPAAYNQGTAADKKCFFQHDTHWINPKAAVGDDNFGKIALFNNRVAENLSTGNILSTNYDPVTKNYTLAAGVFMPVNFAQVYAHPQSATEVRASSSSVSSFQVLPNGNALLCAGRHGYSYEINAENKVIWEYITPLKAGQAVAQGDESLDINNNLTFRVKRYPVDHPALIGREMVGDGFIELNPDTEFCGTLSVNTVEVNSPEVLKVYPNPAQNWLSLDWQVNDTQELYLYDYLGRLEMTITKRDSERILDISHLPRGMYFLSTTHQVIEKILVY